jgi:hypothetical protein
MQMSVFKLIKINHLALKLQLRGLALDKKQNFEALILRKYRHHYKLHILLFILILFLLEWRTV